MFCPKCGNEVPDGAAFCGQCGNKFEARGAARQQVSSQAPGIRNASSKPSIQSAAIAAAVCAALCIVFSLLPWFELSASMMTVSGYASGAASFFGASSGTMEFEESYSVWNIMGLASTFSDYASAYSSLGINSGASGAAALITILSWGCFALWLVAAILLLWGCISALWRHAVAALRAGSVVMVVAVIAFYAFAGALGADTGSATAFPIVCAVLAVVAFACSFGVRKKA